MKSMAIGGLAVLGVLAAAPVLAQPSGGGYGPPVVAGAAPGVPERAGWLARHIHEHMASGELSRHEGRRALAELNKIRREYERAHRRHDARDEEMASRRFERLEQRMH